MPTKHGRLALVAPALILAACGGGASSTATSTPSPSRTLAATPTPAPDSLQVTVVAHGLGTYELTTVPVAVVRNAAGAHAAVGVHVHFTVLSPAGAALATTDGDIPLIAPGETTAIAGRAELSGRGDTVKEDVTVTSWRPANPAAGRIATSDVAYRCETSHCLGYGTVVGTLAATTATSVTVTAVCYDAANAVIGGDTSTTAASAQGTTHVEEPVIVTVRPARCELYATPGA
jgi:hypothetical protein